MSESLSAAMKHAENDDVREDVRERADVEQARDENKNSSCENEEKIRKMKREHYSDERATLLYFDNDTIKTEITLYLNWHTISEKKIHRHRRVQSLRSTLS